MAHNSNDMEQRPARTPRRTASEIRVLLDLFDLSAVTAKEFCSTHGIRETAFYKWRGRYRTREEEQAFIPLHVASPSSGEAALFAEVNGIRIYQAVPASYLKELVS